MASSPSRKPIIPHTVYRTALRYIAPDATRKVEVTMDGGKGIYVGGTLLSIVLSLVLYMTGRREAGIFVGLWAPTILNLGQSLLDED
jgi:hypothetical protein